VWCEEAVRPDGAAEATHAGGGFMSSISLPVLATSTTGAAAEGTTGGSCASGETGVAGAMPVQKETTVGNYFVANYPPFGYWKREATAEFRRVLEQPPRVTPAGETAMGVYAHIPFCRKRCHFCYFRVYTDKNSTEIRSYLDAMLREFEIYAKKPFIGGRKPKFVYFGGGTPSYLSPEQFKYLSDGMKALLPWDEAEEITVEAEPGTLNDRKLRALLEMGVTRLSLGIEHFDDHVLEINGRAHRSKEIHRAYNFARQIGFPQINIDLIAGMLEETEEKWADTVEKTIAIGPDTVTIYQMEVPYNTTIYQKMKAEGSLVAPVADWTTKRRWVNEAFARFEAAGYSVTSATTVVKDPAKQRFVYRNGLFNGSDVVSIGVSAFGQIGGVNYQNQHDFTPYIEAVKTDGLPTYRAYPLSEDERYIREFALQMKTGRVKIEPFTKKFGRDPRVQFAVALSVLDARGVLVTTPEEIGLTREGLLQVDRLLFEFFLPEHRHGRFA
jgi:oxygen-independent coproporphyrinogen III oxidase